MSYKVCVIWVLIDLHIFSCAAVVKRDVADSLGDQINEKFDELDVSAHVSRVSPGLHLVFAGHEVLHRGEQLHGPDPVVRQEEVQGVLRYHYHHHYHYHYQGVWHLHIPALVLDRLGCVQPGDVELPGQLYLLLSLL